MEVVILAILRERGELLRKMLEHCNLRFSGRIIPYSFFNANFLDFTKVFFQGVKRMQKSSKERNGELYPTTSLGISRRVFFFQ